MYRIVSYIRPPCISHPPVLYYAVIETATAMLHCTVLHYTSRSSKTQDSVLIGQHCTALPLLLIPPAPSASTSISMPMSMSSIDHRDASTVQACEVSC